MKYYEKLKKKNRLLSLIYKKLKLIEVLDRKLDTIELFTICGSTPAKRTKYQQLYLETENLITQYQKDIQAYKQELDVLLSSKSKQRYNKKE